MTKEIRQDGSIVTRNKQRQLHSFDDEPAISYSNGDKYWYKDGLCHRDNDSPAIIYNDGSKFWYKDGQNHRDNGEPARIWGNGEQFWMIKNEELLDHQVIFLKKILSCDLKELPFLIGAEPILDYLIERRFNEE